MFSQLRVIIFLFIIASIAFCDKTDTGCDIRVYTNISTHVNIRGELSLEEGEQLYLIIGSISNIKPIVYLSTNQVRAELISSFQSNGVTGGTVMIYLPPMKRYDELQMGGLRIFYCEGSRAVELRNDSKVRVLTKGGGLPSIKTTRRRVLLYAKSFKHSEGYSEIALNSITNRGKQFTSNKLCDNDELSLYILHWPIFELQEGRKNFYDELNKWGIDTNEFNNIWREQPLEDELHPEI